MSLRVGFQKFGGAGWQGGHNYLVNLLRCLLRFGSNRVQPILFVDDKADSDSLSDYLSIEGLEIVRSPACSGKRRLSSLVRALLVGRDSFIASALVGKKVDVMFEVGTFFGWRPNMPIITWIPDFQHKELPELFSPTTRIRRELAYRFQFAAGRTIMLSSNYANSVCEQHYRPKKGQVAVVRFAVGINPKKLVGGASDVRDKYGLDLQYFYMPNQYWKHKNQMLVVDALTSLQAQNQQCPIVVSTGASPDPRYVGYFEDVKYAVKTRNLTRNFRILGNVPYSDVLGLFQGAAALLNPSLYEGWSTTVEEAKLIGAPTILSDLPVHKEQATERAIFFDRNSPSALAQALTGFDLSWANNQKQVREDALSRAKRFAEEFIDVALGAAGRAAALDMPKRK